MYIKTQMFSKTKEAIMQEKEELGLPCSNATKTILTTTAVPSTPPRPQNNFTSNVFVINKSIICSQIQKCRKRKSRPRAWFLTKFSAGSGLKPTVYFWS